MFLKSALRVEVEREFYTGHDRMISKYNEHIQSSKDTRSSSLQVSTDMSSLETQKIIHHDPKSSLGLRRRATKVCQAGQASYRYVSDTAPMTFRASDHLEIGRS